MQPFKLLFNFVGFAVAQNPTAAPLLDATNVDVYADAHAVVVLFDPKSPSTWAYVRQLLPKIPQNLPIMVLANFRDEDSEHTVLPKIAMGEVHSFIASFVSGLPNNTRRVLAFECSLLDCFGLKTLYNAFNVPYLDLKLAAAHAQVKQVNAELLTVR